MAIVVSGGGVRLLAVRPRGIAGVDGTDRHLHRCNPGRRKNGSGQKRLDVV
jgi:hypothetical protein